MLHPRLPLGSEEEHSLTWVSDSQSGEGMTEPIHPGHQGRDKEPGRSHQELATLVTEKPLQRHVPSDHSLTATKPEQIPEWYYKK